MRQFDCGEEILKARILIVDDQPVNNRLLETILAREGFTNLTTTTDSREAVRLYAEQPCDLLLLDWEMPHLSGGEVMAAVRRHADNSYIPVVVITAHTDRAVRLDALRAGAQDFLQKPIDPLEVVPRITGILRVRMLTSRLEEQVRRRTAELERAQLEIIERLGRAAEYRDNETSRHVTRVSKYAGIVGRALGLDPDRVAMLENAVPMHDLGKIGIPDNILLKPGKLHPLEFESMKRHSEIGARILETEGVELLQTAHAIALTHHEKWDGSGYPAGLKGEAIPLEGRICAVVDVFDALTSDRPYKKAWSVDKSLDLLRRQSGSHFDPRVVQAFMDHLDDVLAVRDRFSD
ncbi:MAG: response regulator [Magnetococcales bacterium]|nr:response regulator [Magnetococcales bacterium]